MTNTQINRKAIEKIARALEDLNEKIIYVGGAVISLYIDDPAADDVRPTKDIDIIAEIASLVELEALRSSLIVKGFTQSHEEEVTCRFHYDDIKVDVMATKAIDWAPANPWFDTGFKYAQEITIEELTIKVMPLPYFLASKLEAYYNRGGKDPRTSPDFEDVVYLLNYTSNIKKLILKAESNVKVFLGEAFQRMLENDGSKEAILGNLYHEDQTARYERIVKVLEAIIDAHH